ncbi:MAG TPA: DUF6311 domain-containing protein [Acetobacteraceae bacterium]|nr:DUF6311 domain-containing protein [Acetobacteraceae bacterium]
MQGVVPPSPLRPDRFYLLSYAFALAIGVAMVAMRMPVAAILGTGAMWTAPSGDLAQSLTGHLALQMDAWRFPPLVASYLFWPHGLSVAMTDSNSLMSLLAKLLSSLTGHSGINLLGIWFALCWGLQPVAAVYALRGLGRFGPGSCVAAALLAAWFPALLYRVGHINLCGHFLILAALGLVFRALLDPARPVWARAGVLLTVTILCHPYLYFMGVALLLSLPVQRLLERDPALWRTGFHCLIAVVVPVGVFCILSGALGSVGGGFGFNSMNLLGPVWPQISGLFGPDLPILDANGGQYEGFNYLGAGILLLLAAAMLHLVRGGDAESVVSARFHGLAVMLVLLTGFALSSRVYAGHRLLLDLDGLLPWGRIFGAARSSGRFFWPVGYALMLFGVAWAARQRRLVAVPLLGAAVMLQYADERPLVLGLQAAMIGGGTRDLPVLPTGARLVTVLPQHECTKAKLADLQDTPVLLAALRAGARLGDAAVARLPRWMTCDRQLADGLALPLSPGEVRVFNDPAVLPLVRPTALGPGASCARQGGTVVCAREAGAVAGEPFPAEPALSASPVPAVSLTGAPLTP